MGIFLKDLTLSLEFFSRDLTIGVMIFTKDLTGLLAGFLAFGLKYAWNHSI